MRSNEFRRHLTYSNVMATAAVFLVLGGGAFAATNLRKNSVGAKQLKRNAVTTAKLKNGAVTSAKVKKGSLLASNFKSGELPRGATGSTGAAGATGPAGPTVAVAGGGYTAPFLFTGTTSLEASAPIEIDQISDIAVWGSMGDRQVACDPEGCEGDLPDDSTDVGIYLESPGGTFPASVPGAAISVEGGGLTRQQVPPLSGVIEDIQPGTYTVKLILSGVGVTIDTFDNGGGLPWVTAVATGSD